MSVDYEDPDFIPHITDKILDSWTEKGLITFSQLLSSNTISSYKVIATKHAVGSKIFFKYLQVRRYISKYIEEYKSNNDLFQYISQDRNKDKRNLSKIHKILQKFNTTKNK